tara:strand:- start:2656 stop:2862 length:207 start_codon:yes stop_codon:yes gene_type:complete
MGKILLEEQRKNENGYLSGLGLASQQAHHKKNLTTPKVTFMNMDYTQFAKRQNAPTYMIVGLEVLLRL